LDPEPLSEEGGSTNCVRFPLDCEASGGLVEGLVFKSETGLSVGELCTIGVDVWEGCQA
jgi:hypothetical protein